MTIATDRGFKIGALYRVIDEDGSDYYKNGMIVRFVEDDDSECPWFTYVSGPKGIYCTGTDQVIAVDLKGLEPVEPTNACSNKSLLLLYINQQYPDDKVLKALVEYL